MTAKSTSTTKSRPAALSGEVIEPTGKTVPARDITPTTDVAEVVVVPRTLKAVAKDLRKATEKTVESFFVVGRLLNEARTLLPGDREFGVWLKGLNLGISQSTANRLQVAASREDEVRAVIAESRGLGKDIGVVTAVKLLRAGEAQPKPRKERAEVTSDEDGDVETSAPSKSDGWYAAFVEVADRADPATLSTDELGEYAGLLKSLVDAYQAERKVRSGEGIKQA